MGTVKNLPGSLERFSSLEYSNAQSFQNLSDNLSRFWKNKNLSKNRESFQTSIFCGLAGVEIFPKIFPRACARRRARIYMEKYIPVGYIYFSKVNRFGKIESFQIPTAKNCDATPPTLAGRRAAILPRKKAEQGETIQGIYFLRPNPLGPHWSGMDVCWRFFLTSRLTFQIYKPTSKFIFGFKIYLCVFLLSIDFNFIC